MSSLLYIVDNGDGWVTQDKPERGRVMGIQTRIGEHLCRQGATSDVVCSPCTWENLIYGRCTRPIGHPGAHVFGARKPEAKS